MFSFLLSSSIRNISQEDKRHFKRLRIQFLVRDIIRCRRNNNLVLFQNKDDKERKKKEKEKRGKYEKQIFPLEIRWNHPERWDEMRWKEILTQVENVSDSFFLLFISGSGFSIDILFSAVLVRWEKKKDDDSPLFVFISSMGRRKKLFCLLFVLASRWNRKWNFSICLTLFQVAYAVSFMLEKRTR